MALGGMQSAHSPKLLEEEKGSSFAFTGLGNLQSAHNPKLLDEKGGSSLRCSKSEQPRHTRNAQERERERERESDWERDWEGDRAKEQTCER